MVELGEFGYGDVMFFFFIKIVEKTFWGLLAVVPLKNPSKIH